MMGLSIFGILAVLAANLPTFWVDEVQKKDLLSWASNRSLPMLFLTTVLAIVLAAIVGRMAWQPCAFDIWQKYPWRGFYNRMAETEMTTGDDEWSLFVAVGNNKWLSSYDHSIFRFLGCRLFADVLKQVSCYVVVGKVN